MRDDVTMQHHVSLAGRTHEMTPALNQLPARILRVVRRFDANCYLHTALARSCEFQSESVLWFLILACHTPISWNTVLIWSWSNGNTVFSWAWSGDPQTSAGGNTLARNMPSKRFISSEQNAKRWNHWWIALITKRDLVMTIFAQNLIKKPLMNSLCLLHPLSMNL